MLIDMDKMSFIWYIMKVNFLLLYKEVRAEVYCEKKFYEEDGSCFIISFYAYGNGM